MTYSQQKYPQSIPIQHAPSHVFFPQETFPGQVPNQFVMEPVPVVNYYQPSENPVQNVSGQPSEGFNWAPVLMAGGGAFLGQQVGGPFGAALGGAAGPLVYSFVTPEQEPPQQVLTQSGLGAVGGGLGGLLGGGLGAGLGAGLGTAVAPRFYEYRLGG